MVQLGSHSFYSNSRRQRQQLCIIHEDRYYTKMSCNPGSCIWGPIIGPQLQASKTYNAFDTPFKYHESMQ